MKIGEYEVEVLSNEKVKVGCQEVTKREVEVVLAAMADYKVAMTPSTAPNHTLVIGVKGPLKGDLFVRVFGKVVNLPTNRTPGDWNNLNSSYDKTTVRILTAEEIGRITKGGGK